MKYQSNYKAYPPACEEIGQNLTASFIEINVRCEEGPIFENPKKNVSLIV
jgi:hypothetical protein